MDKDNTKPCIKASGGAEYKKEKSVQTVPLSCIEKEEKISDCYPALDNDLAVDNLQNNIPEADLQDLN